MQNLEKWAFSMTEGASVLGVSRPTLYRLIQTDGFPVLIIGRRKLIPKKALEEWIEARTRKGGVS